MVHLRIPHAKNQHPRSKIEIFKNLKKMQGGICPRIPHAKNQPSRPKTVAYSLQTAHKQTDKESEHRDEDPFEKKILLKPSEIKLKKEKNKKFLNLNLII